MPCKTSTRYEQHELIKALCRAQLHRVPESHNLPRPGTTQLGVLDSTFVQSWPCKRWANGHVSHVDRGRNP